MPGESQEDFDSAKLRESVETLRSLGVARIVDSAEALTSLLSNDSTVLLPGPIAVVTAQVADYPELLHVLDGQVRSVLDVATGVVHTHQLELAQGAVEPRFAPLVQAAARPNPLDSRGRPLGGARAPGRVDELDKYFQDEFNGVVPLHQLPKDTLQKIDANRDEIEKRARALLGAVRDDGARNELQEALPRRPLVTSPQATPLVIVPFETGLNGTISLGRAPSAIARGAQVDTCPPLELLLVGRLSRLVDEHPDLWVAPRALDLLGFMADRGLRLPKRVVDPAHCALALNPDSPDAAVADCVSANEIPRSTSKWLWDVKREEPPTADLGEPAVALGRVVRELSAQLRTRGLDRLMEDDVAPTIPVLAAMERRGARTVGQDGLSAAWAAVHAAMSRLEERFVDLLGKLDPYRAQPEQLLELLQRRSVVLPADHHLAGNDAKNELARLANHDPRVAALLEARTLAEVCRWLERVGKSGDRMRGHHVPLVSGRWGMNAWNMQGMPKHSSHARHLRSLLVAPDGKVLVGADFSSFELRLIAGLSGDKLLLTASQQRDAIGFLADQFLGQASDPLEQRRRRAIMKSHIHPINYGTQEWGFIQSQTSQPVEDARSDYEVLRGGLGQLFNWRAAQASGRARTTGGWERSPKTKRRSQVENQTISTMVQGTAADILRWCLRELDRTLLGLNAELVFQNHDEIYVAADPTRADRVEAEILDVLENRVHQSGLVPAGIKLVARAKRGLSWADLT